MEVGTLQQMQMKKKKMRHNMCYVGLVVLIILLFLPPALRIFVKDKDDEEQTKKNIYISLNCTKESESINSTFENGIPQNIMYKIKGNITEPKPDEVSTNTSVSETNVSSSISQDNTVQQLNDDVTVYDLLSKHGEFTYEESDDTSTLRLSYSSLSEYEYIFGTIGAQENFYTSKGFSCTQIAF